MNVPDPEAGRAPKGADEIRAKLEAIHAQVDSNPVGPAHAGLDAGARVVIATFFDRSTARAAQDELRRAGIMSSLAARDTSIGVAVDNGDRESAHAVLAAFRAAHPERRPTSVRRDCDGMIFGPIIGLTIGLILIPGAIHRALAYAVAAVFVVSGLLIGHLFDRFRSRGRSSILRLQFDLWEFLVLAALPALAVLLLKLLAAGALHVVDFP